MERRNMSGLCGRSQIWEHSGEAVTFGTSANEGEVMFPKYRHSYARLRGFPAFSLPFQDLEDRKIFKSVGPSPVETRQRVLNPQGPRLIDTEGSI